MSQIIFQPQGAGTDHRNGTILINSPRAAATGWYHNDKVKMDQPPITYSGTATGVINNKYKDRFLG